MSADAGKRIFFVRHAESVFNHYSGLIAEGLISEFERPACPDARVTDRGRLQIQELREFVVTSNFVKEYAIDLIVTSPLTRALETTQGVFHDAEIPILVHPLHREVCHHDCDTGRTAKELIHEFQQGSISGRIDFSELIQYEEGNRGVWWWPHFPQSREPEEEIMERAKLFWEYLHQRPEMNIIVVGHGSFTRRLIGNPSMFNCSTVALYKRALNANIFPDFDAHPNFYPTASPVITGIAANSIPAIHPNHEPSEPQVAYYRSEIFIPPCIKK